MMKHCLDYIKIPMDDFFLQPHQRTAGRAPGGSRWQCGLRAFSGRSAGTGQQAFRDKWIPMENNYFEAFQIKETSDYVV